MYIQKLSNQCERTIKRDIKRGFDVKVLHDLMNALASGNSLHPKYKDHALKGDMRGYRECHIKPDWLLVYRIEGEYIVFHKTGTHADMFG